MNSIAELFDKPIFQALGWTLIHFIWQGALIGIFYFTLSLTLRRRSANVRYTAACMAMLLMLIAPAITLIKIRAKADRPSILAASEWDALEIEPVAVKKFPPSSAESVGTKVVEPVRASTSDAIVTGIQDVLPRFIPWFLALWFAGVLVLSLRFAGGLVIIHRLKRVDSGPGVRIWQERLSSLCQRLKVSRPVRLCESVLVEVPTVVGWLRPVILLPAQALTGLSAEQLEALLAHELAHIRRFDYLINLLQTTIETLFFYHPAVWWVSAQIRQEREHCCDDLAVAVCGNVLTYARALTALEDLRGSGPQLAVAASGGSLLTRIQRLLRGRSPDFHRFESGMAGFIALAAVFIVLAGAQVAFLSRNANAAVKEILAITDRIDGADSQQQPASDIPLSNVKPAIPNKPAAPGRETLSSTKPIEPASEQPSTADDETTTQTSSTLETQDLRSQLLAAGLKNAPGDQMDAFRIHGVTAEFVRTMVGLLSTKLDADAAIALRIHGISPARVSEFKSLGFDRLDADQLIAFGVHGVTAQFINEIRATGCGSISADGFVAFRVHGITPRYIQGLKDLGYGNLSGDQVTAFAIHGVTPLFIQTMKIFIPGRISEDDLLGLKIHGVTADMIKELEIMGFTKLTASQLIGLRIHGVTPKYIRSIQDAGFDRATVNEITELRMHGITADFIQMVKSRGFTDVTLNQLVELRRLNILPSAKQNY